MSTVKAIRLATDDEMKHCGFFDGWFTEPFVIEMDDTTVFVPLRDPEGNDTGTFVVQGQELLNHFNPDGLIGATYEGCFSEGSAIFLLFRLHGKEIQVECREDAECNGYGDVIQI